MEKKYVVKNLLTGEYWSCFAEWDIDVHLCHEFGSFDDAEYFISTQSGKFIIETIYNS